MSILAPRQQTALTRLIATIMTFLSVLGTMSWSDSVDFAGEMGEYMGVILADTAMTPRGEKFNPEGYEVVLFDDFNGTQLDTSVWEYRANGARREGFNSPNQVRVENGNLIMKAEYHEQGSPDALYGEGWYAGMVRTIQEYTYGYFEMKCICSEGGGFWSAWWLNSQAMSGKEASRGGVGGAEIDIFEAFNYKNDKNYDSVSMNVHVDGYSETRSLNVGNYKGNNIYKQYNTYALEWTPEEYIFYINGVECDRTSFADGVSQGPEYAIISLELPSEFSEQPGFSTEFIIDSVTIMQKPV
ncbi:MAG: glycoside hydrolase family 16 protein [Clostridiales bacterium]|nr:glycoside hydrolase family 16 protein [Clostridiales bacterium]